MKTLTIKILAVAAIFGLFANAKAQSDENQPAPPANSTSTDVAPAVEGQPTAPNIIVVPLPTDTAPPADEPPANQEQMDQPQTDVNGQQPSQIQRGQNTNNNGGRFGNRNNGRRNGQNSNQNSNQSENGNASAFVPPTAAGTNGTDELYLNLRNAPIEEVLNYLSDAAGFIIELDTPVRGRVDVWSAKPVSKDEAVQLLNSVLNKNGYAVIRNGRTLRVMSKDDAIHGDIPVATGNDPDVIPKTDEIVTQIIPIRFVEARQLLTDLSLLISPRATIMANEAGNSIIVTDTRANIRHLVEVIKAIDSSAEAVTEVQVFHLQHHDPVEVANLLTTLFSDQGGSGNNNQTPIRFGGGQGFNGGLGAFFGGGRGNRGGGFGQGGGGGGGSGASGQNDRIRRHTRVVAVPDQRTSSILVTAAKDMMDQIREMIEQIDRESSKVTRVTTVRINDADPQQLQQVLQEMFQNGNTRGGRNTQNSTLTTRANQANQSTTSGFGTTGTGFGAGGGFGNGGGGGGGGFRGGGQ